MAGHSKWHNIKHKKAAADAKKAKSFTKLIKEITMSARAGGGDISNNPHLRTLLEKAHEINMPKDNYIRAIKKGTGEIAGAQYEAHTYEGYGPGGFAVIVEVLSDNKNRAIAEVRSVFTRKNGSLGENGSVSWMFERKGIIEADLGSVTEDALVEALLDYAIDDVSCDDESCTIICQPSALEQVKAAAQSAGVTVTEAEVGWNPKTRMALEGEAEERAFEFIQALEGLEDVQNVFNNIA